MKTKIRTAAGNRGLLAVLTLAILPWLVRPAGAQVPTLGITNDSSGTTLFWPVADAGYSLLWTADLASPVSWQAWPAPPSGDPSGNNLVVTLQPTNSQMFFQLVSNVVVVPGAPTLVTQEPSPINYFTAALNGTVQPNGFDTTYWFKWGTNATYGQTTLSNVVSATNVSPVTVQVGINGLAPGTAYHCQLFGSNSAGISSGGDLIFTTVTPLPDALVVTLSATNVTTNSALLQGSINPNGSESLCFFQWGTTTNYGSNTPNFYPPYQNYQVVDTSNTITGLASSTTYHYRLVGYNGGPDEAIGNDVTFTTSAPFQQPAPTAVTQMPTFVTANCETFNGTVNPNGAATTAYFEYGTTTGYGTTLGTNSVGSGNTVSNLQWEICGLAPNTTYHYQIVANNSGGGAVGGDQTFMTGAVQAPPTPLTGAYSNLSMTTATIYGTINPNGATTTGYFEYGTNTSYGTSPGTFPAGTNNSPNPFQAPLSGLLPSTTYHYRIDAGNVAGSVNGADAYFTTLSALSPPTVMTLSPTLITSTNAYLYGTVNPNGSDTHFQFNWGTNTAYGNSTTLADAGSNNTALLEYYFLNGLLPNTTYYYRIVANNAGGTSLGLPVSFTTLASSPAGMIAAGSFKMGDTLDGESDAIPTVTVSISSFYMDTNLVSLSQWQTVYNWATGHGYDFLDNGAGKGANYPVTGVDWYDVVKWCNGRSQLAGLTPAYYTDAGFTQVYKSGEVDGIYPNWTANGYRLPTEAEWEKAARGGLSGQRFPWGDTITDGPAGSGGQANYNSCTACDPSYDLGPSGYNSAFDTGMPPYTSPVGSFAANGYGLYDMAGNVYEWCWDWYGTPYAGGTDPHGPSTGAQRVQRGGSWGGDVVGSYFCRCAGRDSHYPGNVDNVFGFRCVKAH